MEITLTSKYYKEINRQLIISGIVTLIINLIVLIILTDFLLKLSFKKTINKLREIIYSYETGEYKTNVLDIPFIEFKPFISVLSKMGKQIKNQIKELKKSEKKYRSIFENSIEGIFQISLDKRFINVNPTMVNILRYDSPNDLINNIVDISVQ